MRLANVLILKVRKKLKLSYEILNVFFVFFFFFSILNNKRLSESVCLINKFKFNIC